MPSPIHEAIPLEGTAEDAPVARAAARTVLRRAGCDDDLVGDALLCLSELVTNALLHAGGSICVEITATAEAVRLEVTDQRPLDDGLSSPTGRGLSIVEQLSRTWGVDATEVEGRPAKSVWAELSATSAVVDTLDEPTGGEAVLLDVPIRLFLASEAHLEGLVRDMQLLAADWTSRSDTLVKGLADALRRNRDARVASTEEARRRVAAGDDVLTLRFPIDANTPARARDFQDVVAASEARTGRSEDDADPSAVELRHFRRWYVAELTHQARGGAPRRCPFRP